MPTRISRPALPALDPTLVEAWAGVPTTIAADLFRGRVLVDPAIRPMRPLGRAGWSAPRSRPGASPADYGPVHHAIAVAGPAR